MAYSYISDAMLREVALTREEYETIVTRLGRPPNAVELGMFGAMWSEHCGYKNSKPLLRRLPTTGPRVLQGPGENAGAVDIGDGQALVLKIESHNHPSAVEPYQGAATGVGGIIRDIFTMGARPIALLDSLRFGPLEEPRNRYLFEGVVGGIAGYGNCIGIPTVGGETYFHTCYSGNPLVNAMCVGVIDRRDLTRATSGQPGNLVLLVGAATGRGGVHGIEIDLALVPRRAKGMTPYEIMLSESQERMLVVVAREKLPHVLEVFTRWELPAVEVGRVTDDGMVRVREGVAVVAEVPARLFTDECPVYVREGREDPAIAAARARDLAGLPEPEDYGAALLELLREPSIASKRVIWRRYDHTIGTNTVIGPGTDAALLRLKGTRKAVALTTECKARL